MALIVHDGHTLEFGREMMEVTMGGTMGGPSDYYRRFVPGLRCYYFLDGQAISEEEAQAFLASITDR